MISAAGARRFIESLELPKVALNINCPRVKTRDSTGRSQFAIRESLHPNSTSSHRCCITGTRMSVPEKAKGWCLFRRREVTLPTWRGWLLIAVLTAGLGAGVCRNLHRFLAINQPLPGGVLVIEGWLSDRAMEVATQEISRGKYTKLYVTGGPLEQGAFLSNYTNFAQLGAAILLKLGVSSNALVPVPSRWVAQDRTFTSAATLRTWFRERQEIPGQVTVLTCGAHARRSRLLFQQAFGRQVQVGVIAVPPDDYDTHRWWASSQGVRLVIGEVLAYGYARVIFSPPRD